MDDEDVLPHRYITRAAMEFQFLGHAYTNALMPNEVTRSVVFMIIARVSSLDWDVGGVIAPPARIVRRNRVTALADALGRPFETVRRHVKALERDGLVVSDGDGVALAAHSVRAGEITQYLERVHDAFVWLIAQLAAIDLPRIEPRGTIEPSVGEVLIRAIDARLSPQERVGTTFDSWNQLVVWGTICLANTRSVQLDPVLSRRYAYETVPDALRRPVSLQAVATAMQLPYATVWRQAQVLEQNNVVTRQGDGWVVTRANLAEENITPAVEADTRFLMRKLRELTALGLDPGRVEQRYIRGCPELLDLYPGSTEPGVTSLAPAVV